ncbi:MAG TPA: lantibiotic dehydratase [Pyrinomonadaceae bacterium]
MSNLVNNQTTDSQVGVDSVAQAKPSSDVEIAQMKETANLPAHLIALPGGEWALWRWIGLRGAGFPVSQVLGLAASECTGVRDEIVETEVELQRLREEALRALHGQVKNTDAEHKAQLEKAIKRLRKNAAPEPLDTATEAASQVEAFRHARTHLDDLWKEFHASFESALVRQSKFISEMAANNRFQEAIIWQNRQAFHTAVAALADDSTGHATRNSKRRQHEELVAKYLQRYCTKNDTIGTFGPVGWAKFVDDGAALKAMPGASLIAERNVYFEVWAMDALAQALTKDKEFLPWLVPRRMPYVDTRDDSLYVPKRKPIRISGGQVALLRACDGKRNAREIADELVRTQPSEFRSTGDVFMVLEIFQKNQLISWRIEAPLELYPERTLQKWFERIGDEELRVKVLSQLGEMEDARRAVVAASDDAPKLNDAFIRLETTFTRLTDVAPTRSAGGTYAARTLIYEDSRRDIEVELGSEILESVGPALSLILTSARWLTCKAAGMGNKYFADAYDELSAASGSKLVEFIEFYEKLKPLFGGDQENVFDATLRPLLRKKWADVLAIPTDLRAVEYRSEDLRERVMSVFDAPPPEWPLARYQCPDLMIAASSADAIQRGEYKLVLGELHVAWNTLAWWLFVAQHPAPAEILKNFEIDLPEPLVAPIIPKSHWAGRTARLLPARLASKDYRIEALPAFTNLDPKQIVVSSELVVERADGELVIRARDGRVRFTVREVYSELLSQRISSSFGLLNPNPYRPRVSIDNLVVCREAWRFNAAEMEFAFVKDEAERFVAARRWTHRHGIPRFAFISASAVEAKPFYMDFDSPAYVNILAKVIRHASELKGEESGVTVTEMLPASDETWLPDAAGQHYTSELRIVALDSAR